MSLLKSEAQLAAVNELGNRLDDALDSATKDLYKEEGAVSALKNACGSLDNLLKVISKDLDEKQVDLETQVLVKKYFDRARSIINALAATAENSRQSQVGKIAAFQHSVTIARKYKDEELKKYSVMRSAIERSIEQHNELKANSDTSEINQGPRPVGVRPPPRIKMQRLDADAIASSASASSTPQQATHTDTDASEARTVETTSSSSEVLSSVESDSATAEEAVEAPAIKKSKKQKK